MVTEKWKRQLPQSVMSICSLRRLRIEKFRPKIRPAQIFARKTHQEVRFMYPKEIVREEVKYIEKPHPRITEIRIFFDNGTYEVFKPEKLIRCHKPRPAFAGILG